MNYSDSEKKLEARRNLQSWILSLPGLIWLLLFFFIPYLVMLFYSFLQTTGYDIEYRLSFGAYREILQPQYIRACINALRLATVTTLVCLVLGYPAAYFIARSPKKLRNLLLVLIIIPFWTNFMVRIFAWRIFLAPEGVLNHVLLYLHIIDRPLRILRTDLAVTLVMVYVYLPYMSLPLYSAIERIDFSLLEAAEDLGANWLRAFFKVTLPLSKEGIMAGGILVFIPSLGAYIIPQIMGGQSALYIGQIITYRIKNIPRNWPLASSLSFVLLMLIAVLLLFYYHYFTRTGKTPTP